MSHPSPQSASDNAQSLSLQTGWPRPPHASQPSNELPQHQPSASPAMNSSSSSSGRPTGLGSPDVPSQALQQPSSSATPHRPNPSPVRTNYTPYRSPNLQGQPPSSSSPAQDSPSSAIASSPVDRNLSGPTFADSPGAQRSGSLSSGPSVTTEVTNPPSEPGHGAASPETSANGESRSLPDTIRQSGSPTAWPSIPKKAAGRAAQRMMPRTSSIDSAISSLSLGSHSHKSSFDANSVTSADINNLIAAAGSAEALILHLLKDKHHASSQNEQLWRLLEKQRALVLGLNRDLERALKDKELYRKKFKELQSQLHEMRSRLAAAEEANARNAANQPSAQSAAKDGAGPVRDSVRNSDVFLIQSNAEPAPNETAPDSRPSTSPEDAAGQSAGPEQSTNAATPPAPSRKPPPAPLDLGRTHGKHIPTDSINDSQSESNYDDHSISDEEERRGRRRTREEDDREREAAALREQEARSRSKKQSKQSSAAPNKDADSTLSPWRAAASPSHLNHGQFPRTDSLAAIVNSGPRDPSLLSDRHAPPTPGLPSSPRPADRPLGSPLPRQPRQGTAIMSPPLSPKSATHGSMAAHHGTKPPASPHVDNAHRQIPTIDPSVKIDSPKTPYGVNRTICQDLVSEEYPGLLLPPNALPSIEVKVASSRLRPSRSSYFGGRPNDEDPVFVLSVFSRANRAELWRVEKAIQALPQLDQQIRQMCDFNGKLPDRSIFSGHSPAKIDARREALNSYFETLLDTPMSEAAAIVVCRFLSTDAIEPRDDESALVKANGKTTPPELLRGPDGKPWKEGWLTKRGKNFGGWKSRYFVLHGPEFKYYESPGGPHLGTIRIHHAQIGKQAQSGNNQSPSRLDDDHDNQYRHAFLILEPKRKDPSSFVRHVLCAESDEERDAWVDALLAYVEPHSDEEQKATQKSHSGKHSTRSRLFSGRKNGKGTDSPDVETQDTVQGFSYDDAVPAEPPMYGPSYEAAAKTSTEINDPNGQGSRAISGPTNGAVIQDAGAWGNKTTSVKEKKRSIWGFRTRSTLDLLSQSQENNGSLGGDRAAASRPPVFGMPLAEAVQYCGPNGVDVELPAVVYRCIEYLRAKNAASEEGIFRLSGSNVVVKALKERFNAEGDVNFLADDEYHDVHAVASLFKQYLRELPTSVLTRDLHPEFLSVLGEFRAFKHVVAVLTGYQNTMTESSNWRRSTPWCTGCHGRTELY